MTYKQLRQLDKNQKGERLMCLKYVRLAFSPSNDDLIPANTDNAKLAWDRAKVKHANKDFPKGVAVPVFWNYETTIDGVKKNYGHIAIYLDGKVYSNPGSTSKDNPHVFDSLSAIEKSFGLGSYLGWTEDVNGVAIVEKVKVEVAAQPKVLVLPASLGVSVPVYGYSTGNKVGTLNPQKFGGLEYDILETTGNGDRVVMTRDYGKVRINPKYGSIKGESTTTATANNIGKKWTNSKTPLTLYNEKGVAYSGPSTAKRTYIILAENKSLGLIQIQHPLFNAPSNKVWVKVSDGTVG